MPKRKKNLRNEFECTCFPQCLLDRSVEVFNVQICVKYHRTRWATSNCVIEVSRDFAKFDRFSGSGNGTHFLQLSQIRRYVVLITSITRSTIIKIYILHFLLLIDILWGWTINIDLNTLHTKNINDCHRTF